MNFWEAVQAMKDGKVVTSRSNSIIEEDGEEFLLFWHFHHESEKFWLAFEDGTTTGESTFDSEEILATDWEIVDKPEDFGE